MSRFVYSSMSTENRIFRKKPNLGLYLQQSRPKKGHKSNSWSHISIKPQKARQPPRPDTSYHKLTVLLPWKGHGTVVVSYDVF